MPCNVSVTGKPKIAISACLLGENVRFNGGHKQSPLCSQTLSDYFDFVPLCPEVAIGLGIPREPIRLVGDPLQPQAVGTVHRELNVTGALDEYGQRMAAEHTDLCGYIFTQEVRPAYGRVKVYRDNGTPVEGGGRGIYAQAFCARHPNLPVEEDGRLHDPVLRENFLTRVFVYATWQQLLAQGLTRHQLLAFHSRYKYLLMAHSPAHYKSLGNLLGSMSKDCDLPVLAAEYFSELMTALKKCATRGTHSNVLQHISGIVPLVVPLTLLKHHFRQHPDRYIAQQAYLQPHPENLSLHVALALEQGWLPIREVARQTGVNAVTLRAWERRYGLIVPQRTPKGHRLFNADHVQRIQTILTWLNRGVPVSQVKQLIDNAQPVDDSVENEWQNLRQTLIQAIGQLAERRVDDVFNRAMALYPPRTLCEQLLLPLLKELEQRWQGQFGAQMERVFFHSWLRSKFGARMYHNNRQLNGPPLLLINHSDLPLEPHLWLSAWLASSADCPVEVFDWPLPTGELALAVEHLQPRAGPVFDWPLPTGELALAVEHLQPRA
eukprot:gene12270-12060_t